MSSPLFCLQTGGERLTNTGKTLFEKKKQNGGRYGVVVAMSVITFIVIGGVGVVLKEDRRGILEFQSAPFV